MDNVIPWSQIHPTIQSQAPFVGVVLIDPERQLCVSELISLDGELLGSANSGAGDILAAAQQAAAVVTGAYRQHRSRTGTKPSGLRVIEGGSACVS